MSAASSDSSQVVSRVLPKGADQLFAVLADPAQHPKIDGSGTVKGAASSATLSGVGDVFTMEMSQPSIGEYQTDNRIVEFKAGRKIAWTTGGAGRDPIGHVWAWELTPQGDSTVVTHSYDWSGVTDEGVLAQMSFPRVTAEQMGETIDHLGEAAS